MDSRATESEILELENKLLHPTAGPISVPLYYLKLMTRDFCIERELGRGGYGVVYKGILRCGSVIAVKKFNEIILAGDHPSFENEASFLMDLKHQNIIQLLGYCAESKGVMIKQPTGKVIVAEAQTRMLCFEYMCNGGLDKHLSDESSGLEWNTRYKIIRGICSGLKYLHGRNIIHLDLKPQNILMDTTMVPKFADFGLSRFLSEQKSKTVSSNCRGTTGYMAPEYIDRGIISKKADIFSLGVIIIEILKGCRDDYPDHRQSTEADFQHFTEKVLSNWRNRFERSSKYTSPELHTQLVKQCIHIALECVHPDKEKRPDVSNIIEDLNVAEESCCVQNGKDLLVEHQEIPSCSSKLQELEINNVTGFTAAAIHHSLIFSSLTKLEIKYDMLGRFTEQQEALLFVDSLECIGFVGCSNLQSLPERLHTLHNLKRLYIRYCEAIQMLPKDGLPSSLEQLYIWVCPELQSLLKDCLPDSLRKLVIEHCPAIRSLPEVDDLPSSLRELHVHLGNSEELRSQCRKLINIIPIVRA